MLLAISGKKSVYNGNNVNLALFKFLGYSFRNVFRKSFSESRFWKFLKMFRSPVGNLFILKHKGRMELNTFRIRKAYDEIHCK